MPKLKTAFLQAGLLSFSAPFALAASALWYFLLYRQGYHFNPELEMIATAAWIPVFGLFYGVVAGLVLYSVWSDYQNMETAVRKGDKQTFLELRDKRVPPPIYTMMFAFAASLLAVFMGLKYPDLGSGLCCVSSTAYLLTLVFFAIREMDDPTSGIWYIEGIPPEWLKA